MINMTRLNVQGLSRRSAELMKCLQSHTGYITVSMDLASGEPSVTAHYSGDQRYRHATVDGVGSRPTYKDSILYIDDIYIMTMSVSPMHKKMLWDYFHSFDFASQWLKDPEVIKDHLKKHRQVCKMLALALSYGMQPRKMVKQMYENGVSISFKDAKAFYEAYWQLFSGVRRLADRLEFQIKQDGAMVNEFGYRLTPEPRKAFNYLIQSSVSGIIHILTAKLFAIAPYARFLTVIHDEILAECPIDKLEEFRQAKDEATRLLNEELGWTTQVRVGFKSGLTWMEAK